MGSVTCVTAFSVGDRPGGVRRPGDLRGVRVPVRCPSFRCREPGRPRGAQGRPAAPGVGVLGCAGVPTVDPGPVAADAGTAGSGSCSARCGGRDRTGSPMADPICAGSPGRWRCAAPPMREASGTCAYAPTSLGRRVGASNHGQLVAAHVRVAPTSSRNCMTRSANEGKLCCRRSSPVRRMRRTWP